MRENLLERIFSIAPRFKMTVWDPEFGAIKADDLFTICLGQLRKDLQNSSANYRRVRGGETFAIVESVGGEYRIGYYHYDGVLLAKQKDYRLRFLTGDKGKLTREIPFKDLPFRIRVASHISAKRLTRIDGAYSQRLASTADPSVFVKESLGDCAERLCEVKHNEEDKISLNLLQRTKLVFTLGPNLEEVEQQLRSAKVGGISFLDCFATSIVHGIGADELYDLGTIPYQHLNLDPDVYIFSRFSTALDFIKGRPDQRYTIVTDRFTQVYSASVWQRLAELDNYDLLHIGKLSDFRHFYNKEGVFPNQDFVTPAIVNASLPSRRIFKKQIFNVVADEIDEIIRRAHLKRKELQQYSPESAKKFTRLVSAICRALTPSSLDSLGLIQYEVVTGMSLTDQISITQQYQNPKYLAIQKFLSDADCAILVDDIDQILSSELSSEIKLQFVEISTFQETAARTKRLIIYFVDKWFLLNMFFPMILLGKLDLANITFVLYQFEIDALLGIHQQFLNAIRKCLRNGAELCGADYAEDENIEDASQEIIDSFDSALDFDLFSRRYFLETAPKDQIDWVNVQTFGLSDGARDYLAFLTSRYKPYVIDEENLSRKELEAIELDDTLIFFEGHGERGILDTYTDSFFIKDGEHIKRVKEWKRILAEFLGFDGERLVERRLYEFLKCLELEGLSRSDFDVLRWLDSESIGTLNPKEDFKRIAKVIGNRDFLRDYLVYAESCVYLQTKCKHVGKILKKLAIRDFAGAEVESALNEVGLTVKDDLDRIVKKIKKLRVRYIDRTFRPVMRFNSNILIDSSDAQANPTLFEQK